jgi:hypothetical protein
MLSTLRGSTSDEIWPQLEAVVRELFPGLKERLSNRDVKRRHSLSDALLAEDGCRRKDQDSEKVDSWCFSGFFLAHAELSIVLFQLHVAIPAVLFVTDILGNTLYLSKNLGNTGTCILTPQSIPAREIL